MVDGRIIDTDAVDLDDEKVKIMTRAMILATIQAVRTVLR